MPLFVASPRLHTLFRFVAAFLVAPYLLYVGYTRKLPVVFLIGLGTLLIDSWTFFLSVRSAAT